MKKIELFMSNDSIRLCLDCISKELDHVELYKDKIVDSAEYLESLHSISKKLSSSSGLEGLFLDFSFNECSIISKCLYYNAMSSYFVTHILNSFISHMAAVVENYED